MNRLEPVLKQKFWILLGVAAIMTITGWWMATSTMVAAITKRRQAIEAAINLVPKTKIPGDSWATKLNEINTAQAKSITVTKADLWKRQLAKMMEWPADVQPKNGYLGVFSNESKEEYRDIVYVDEVTKVWKKLRPLEPDGSGIVQYPLANMYALLRKEPEWQGVIADNVMWEIKEDLALLESLFQSIAIVNGGPDVLRTSDMVHQIDVLELRGGGPSKAKPITPFAPPAGASLSALPVISAEFNPAEEWGDDGSASQARFAPQGGGRFGGGGGRNARLSATGRPIDEDDAPTMRAGGLGGGGAAAPPAGQPVQRYISNDPNLPYKTRGFYLSVQMDHQKIPQLIAELTANDRSVWPVEIIRVQMSRLHEDLTTGASGASIAQGGPQGGGRPNIQRAADDEDPPELRIGSNFAPAQPMARGPTGALNAPAMITDQTRAAKASLEKALSNSNIAHVTICGVFTLYQKVADEPAAAAPAAPPAAAAPSTNDSAPTEAAADSVPAAADDTNPSDDPAPAGDSVPATEPTADAQNQTTDQPVGDSQPSEPDGNTNSSPEATPTKKEESDEK